MIATQIHTAVVLEARLPLDKWALEPMRYSIGMEKSVFVREARAAFGAAAAASGFGSLPACTPWLDSTMILVRPNDQPDIQKHQRTHQSANRDVCG